MKQFEVVLYPLKQSDFAALDSRLSAWLKKNCKEWLIAIHEPFSSPEYSNDLHRHYYGQMHSDWDIKRLASSLGLEAHQIQKVKNQWKTAILYARHINKAPKPLIPMAAIQTNIEDYEKICNAAIKEGYPVSKKRCMPSVITDYANNVISYEKMLESLTFEQFNDFKRDIDNAKIFRMKKGINRDMKVVYLTGMAGSGKTTLAKFIGQNMGYDIFISGSGKDPLDGYDNQECIILDDLRADAFTKSELFKLLDNNTNSSVKSRYFNKAITCCKLLIITSIKTPQRLYDWRNADDDEPFSQFARRLNFTYVYVRPNGVLHEMKMNAEDPLNGAATYRVAPYSMDLVYSYFNIVKGMEEPLQSLMFNVSKAAREHLERKAKNEE